MSVTLLFDKQLPLTITVIDDHTVKFNDLVFTSKQVNELDAEELGSYNCHRDNGYSHALSLLLASMFFSINDVKQIANDSVLMALSDTIIIRLSTGLPCNSTYRVTPSYLFSSSQKRRLPTTGTELMDWDFNETLY